MEWKDASSFNQLGVTGYIRVKVWETLERTSRSS